MRGETNRDDRSMASTITRAMDASFATVMAMVNDRKASTIPLTIDYYSGVTPHLQEIQVRTCTNIDIDGFSAALVRRYNETRNERALSKRDVPGESTTEPPHIETQEEADRWVIDQLRAQGVLVDLPKVGKLAPPEPVRPKPPPGPYDPELFDPDAFIAPGDNLAQQEGIVRVEGPGCPGCYRGWTPVAYARVCQAPHRRNVHRSFWFCVCCVSFIRRLPSQLRYSGTTGIDVPVKDEDNWFEPQQFLTDFEVPTHFEPGAHHNAFVIHWFCVGDTIGTWNNIYWTLHGSTVSATRVTPRCRDNTEAQQNLDEALTEIEKVQNDPRMRQLFGFNDNDDDDDDDNYDDGYAPADAPGMNRPVPLLLMAAI